MPPSFNSTSAENLLWSIPPDLTITREAHWTRSPHMGHSNSDTAVASFELPLTSEKIFLQSAGPFSKGDLKVIADDEVRGYVVVRVYVRTTVPGCVRVCEVRKVGGGGGNQCGVGVGVFTRSNRTSRNGFLQQTINFQCEVIVSFPRATSPRAASLTVSNFETDMPGFTHLIGKIARVVSFKNISLGSANALIDIGSIRATRAVVKTNNAAIQGVFVVIASLELVTSNAMIQCAMVVVNHAENRPTKVSMKSSNGNINSNIMLYSFPEPTETTAFDRLPPLTETGGSYTISTQTSNAPISLDISEAPKCSTLNLNATTSNAKAHVRLPKRFSGEFDVGSSRWSGVDVRYGGGERDEEGNLRYVDVRKDGSWRTRGFVRWGPVRAQGAGAGRGGGGGNVVVSTSNASASLQL